MKNVNEKKKVKLDPLVAALMPDSDKKMGAIASGSLLVALALCFWAAAFEQLVPEVAFVDSVNENIRATMQILDRKEGGTSQKKDGTGQSQESGWRRPPSWYG